MANYQSLNKQILNRRENWRQFYGFTKSKPLETIPIQRLFPLEGVSVEQTELIESAHTQMWCAKPLAQAFFENFSFKIQFDEVDTDSDST